MNEIRFACDNFLFRCVQCYNQCGISRRIERGQRNVSLVNIIKLARGLRISMGELFKGIH